jgi:uncharacterized protein YoxC
MAKHWEDMKADEKADQLRDELNTTRRQFGVLMGAVQDIGKAVKNLEKKIANK